MSSIKLTFDSANGHQLAAVLDMPVDGTPAAFALFAHCFTCTKNIKAANHISRALARQGVAVLRFDFTGLGESGGDFSDTNFSSNVEDLISAAQFLSTQYRPPEILVGHSLGGAAVLQAAAGIPSAKAVATIGAPGDPKHVTRLLSESRAAIESAGEAEVMLEGRRFKIKKQFIEDLEQSHFEPVIRNLNKALLILHSPVDKIVGIQNAADIFQTARHPKSFISLDQADHLLSDSKDSQYVGAMIAAWANKYIQGSEDAASTVVPSQHQVTTRTGDSGFTTEIVAGRHRLVADEPRSVGGSDTGPTPYDYLAAALGACTSMTLRMYADRKKWPLESATVHLRHRKIHARDCRECETDSGVLDHIDREISLEGRLTSDQKTRLMEIADRCPVHRTLHSEIVVNTRLTE